MIEYVDPTFVGVRPDPDAMTLKLFALGEEVASLEAILLTLRGDARFLVLLRLAWYKRQRHCGEALRFVEEAQSWLDGDPMSGTERSKAAARLLLIRAEIEYLFARLDGAQALAEQAQRAFGALGDAVGTGDTHWLMSSVWSDRGDTLRCSSCLKEANRHYIESGDQQRITASVARELFIAAFRDPAGAATRLAQLFRDAQSSDLAVAVWVNCAQAVVSNKTDDPGASIALGQDAWRQANQSGQIRQAIVSALNVSDSFATLGDLEAALEWAEIATGRARETGWPGMVGACLQQTGNGLRKLGRFDEAKALLQEALIVAHDLSGSRNYAVILEYLGELCLDAGDATSALKWFCQYEDAARTFAEPSMHMVALRGQATALSRLGKPDDANVKVKAALRLSQEHGYLDEQIEAFRALAELHRSHPLPALVGMSAPSSCLHYLEQALSVAAAINGYLVPLELLQDVSRAYAASGNFELAYEYAQVAAKSVANARHTEANQRALAMRVRFETQRSRAEAEHHRKLAQTESEKALALQQTSATLEVLGLIGREITACLDLDDVCEALYRHVNELLDASSFDIYLVESGGEGLYGAFSMENGKPYGLERIPYSDTDSYTVRCARERLELSVNLPPGLDNPNLIAGTVMTHSLFFSPLLVGERLLGVMSIQSANEHAYGEREHAIFRTLSAYGAIALDNAGAYALAQRARAQADGALVALRDAQVRLVQSEKMAALGRLVAGIAHELNTPLGNGLMALTTLRSQLQTFRQAVATAGLRRSEFDAFLENVNAGSELALNGVSRSTKLVSKFKQLAIQKNQADRGMFLLADAVNQAVVSQHAPVETSSLRIEVDIPPTLELDSFPQALVETLENLLSNALIHGLDGHQDGLIRVEAQASGMGTIQLRVIDNGVGIRPEDLPHIFDPFFSTRFGQGGSGLGLHLSHNLVTQILGGQITVVSREGEGSTFLLDLPIRAPVDDSIA